MTTFAARSLPPADRDEAPAIEAATEPPKVDNDFFLSVSHDLFSIGTLHRVERDSFLHALRCSAERKPEQLTLAVAALKDSAERISNLAGLLQTKLANHSKVTR